MKSWQKNILITVLTALVVWLFSTVQGSTTFKAKQEVLNSTNSIEHFQIKNDIQISRKTILKNLERINNNILKLKDSVSVTNQRIEHINYKINGMDKKIKFIFKNTKDLNKYQNIFSDL